MKKIITTVILTGLLSFPFFVFAGIIPSANSSIAGQIGKQTYAVTSIDNTLDTVANYTIGVLVVISVFYVIWAGYTFTTSAGDPDKVGEARKRIMFAGIGIIVALLAKGIISLVLAAIKG
jgi:hypothetical protein